jgi:hypothetical protein
MFHLSRAIVFISIMVMAFHTAWWVGLICLIACMFFIPTPKGGVRG